MLTCDFLARRYSKLPSEILESGTTMDLEIAEVAVGYEQYVSKQQKSGTPVINHNYSQDELKAMVDSVKGR
jgi:hypothetical protein